MNYYPHHIGDFNNSTRHLTRVERALYRELIELYYDNEHPLQSVDFDRLCRRILAVDECEKESVKYVLSEFFVDSDGVYTHSRCDLEIEKYRANNSAKARAGKASAEARRKKKEGKEGGSIQQNLTRVEQVNNGCATNQEPITSNQEPITNINTKAPTMPACPHNQIIDLYHEHLPELKSVTKSLWKGSQREKDLRARWKQSPNHQSLEFWSRYFQAIKKSESTNWYFSGNGTGDFANWSADLGWLVKNKNFTNTIERLTNA